MSTGSQFDGWLLESDVRIPSSLKKKMEIACINSVDVLSELIKMGSNSITEVVADLKLGTIEKAVFNVIISKLASTQSVSINNSSNKPTCSSSQVEGTQEYKNKSHQMNHDAIGFYIEILEQSYKSFCSEYNNVFALWQLGLKNNMGCFGSKKDKIKTFIQKAIQSVRAEDLKWNSPAFQQFLLEYKEDNEQKEEIEKFMIQIPTDVPNRRASDIIAITPANEKLWETIRKMKRTQWGYTYLAPLKSDPDIDTLIMDKNTTWEKTINPMDKSNSYGQTKFVDCSEKIGKMDDGQYEIRYYQCSGTWQWRRTLKAVSIINGVAHVFS